MVIVNYTKNGEAISDFEAESFARKIANMTNGYFEVCNEIAIHTVRTLVLEKFLDINGV